jgi:hypothetical protein
VRVLHYFAHVQSNIAEDMGVFDLYQDVKYANGTNLNKCLKNIFTFVKGSSLCLKKSWSLFLMIWLQPNP